MTRMIATALFFAASLGGCKHPPRVGDGCSLEGVLACESNERALVCIAKGLESVPCRGPKGCVAGDRPSCDRSLGQEGDPCPYTPDKDVTAECSADKRSQLACRNRKLIVERDCHGPDGCTPSGCDQSIAEVGRPCRTADPGACSSDGKAILTCEVALDRAGLVGSANGRFRVKHECPTKNGCQRQRVGTSASFEPSCDFSGSSEKSPCGKSNAGSEVCGPEGKSVLRCGADGRFETKKNCEGDARCLGDRVDCM